MPETGARSILLGPATEGGSLVAVVPAGELKAARCCGECTLSDCFVAPGFDFADFAMHRGRNCCGSTWFPIGYLAEGAGFSTEHPCVAATVW